MSVDLIRSLIGRIDRQELERDLFYLAKDPLPVRKLNYTLPGHPKSTLEEADDYIADKIQSWGYVVERESVQVQALRRDESKPLPSRHAPPEPSDPWYTAHNLYAKKLGTTHPDDIIVVVAHKDSQSWIDSPGAYDNAVGTVATMAIARTLHDVDLARSVWFLFCNEEHRPWTSVTAAKNAKSRGDHIVAVFNLDGLGGKAQEEVEAGRRCNVTAYSTDEGRKLAELMAEVNTRYDLGLTQSSRQREFPNDDDGSFVKAGFGAAVLNIGSFPYSDPNYHSEGDTPERVDLDNVHAATRAALAAVVELTFASARRPLTPKFHRQAHPSP